MLNYILVIFCHVQKCKNGGENIIDGAHFTSTQLQIAAYFVYISVINNVFNALYRDGIEYLYKENHKSNKISD